MKFKDFRLSGHVLYTLSFNISLPEADFLQEIFEMKEVQFEQSSRTGQCLSPKTINTHFYLLSLLERSPPLAKFICQH